MLSQRLARIRGGEGGGLSSCLVEISADGSLQLGKFLGVACDLHGITATTATFVLNRLDGY